MFIICIVYVWYCLKLGQVKEVALHNLHFIVSNHLVESYCMFNISFIFPASISASCTDVNDNYIDMIEKIYLYVKKHDFMTVRGIRAWLYEEYGLGSVTHSPKQYGPESSVYLKVPEEHYPEFWC